MFAAMLVKLKDFKGLKNRRGFAVNSSYLYRLIHIEKTTGKKAPFKWVVDKNNVLIEVK